MTIIDTHAHIYPDAIASKAVHTVLDYYHVDTEHLDGTVGSLLKMGDATGISRFLIHSVATTPHQVASINRFIAENVNAHPDKFIGFATLHPESETVEADVEHAIELGLHGIKLHPDFQKFSLDSKQADRIFSAIEGRLPVLIHVGDNRTQYSEPKKLLHALRHHPKLTVIGAHFGGWSVWDDGVKYLADTDIFVDTCSTQPFIQPEKVRQLIDAFGVDRIFFGSDYPMWNAATEINMLNKIVTDEEEREKIYHLNFERFFDKYCTESK